MDPMEMVALWESILQELKQHIDPHFYDVWIKSSIIPYSYENDTLTLDTTMSFVCGFVQKKYSNILRETASKVIGKPTKVVLINSDSAIATPASTPEDSVVIPAEVKKSQPAQEKTIAAEPVEIDTTPVDEPVTADVPLTIIDIPELPLKTSAPETTAANESDQLNSNYTFDTFIVGNSNRIAHAAALSIAEAPAVKYNPFFIYGGSGLGKTHLMHAIGHRIREKFPDMRLCCITSEDFANELISSIKDKNPESFRKRYRNIDILLVDDIQFLENKEHTQEEFFHTFNTLYRDHKQMVFTSDRPPQDIKKMEERLRSRFQGGMVTSIDPPDLETRTAILRKKAEVEHINIQKDAIDYIASIVNENMRELEGAFFRVLMQASQEKTAITIDLTRRALKDFIHTDKKKYVTIDEIQTSICKFYRIKIDDLLGKKKTKNIAYPRQIAMYLCRELTPNTFPHIGKAFGGRDHTTVMHACDKITKDIERDEKFKEMIEKIVQRINGVDN